MKRRSFLGAANCAAISTIPLINTLLNLRLTGSVAAESVTPGDGYRALVCLFFSGGNDSFNMLAPYSGPSATAADSYAEYAASRTDLSLTKATELIEITPDNTPGRSFGVHYRMPNLASLFTAGDAAFVANVGTLIEPVMNRTQVALATRRLPLGLYSHSDQIEQWQTSVPNSRSGVGWAGRTADLIRSLNSEQSVSMNISVDGSNVWQTGVQGAEYAVNPGNDNEPVGGAVALTGYQRGYDVNDGFVNATGAAVDSQLGQTYSNLLELTFQEKRKSAQDAYDLYSAAVPGTLPVNVVFPNTSVGRQLHQVAKTIAGRNGLGACRQTFFVNRGGWDHHNETLQLQFGMLNEVDAAVAAFWQAITAMGLQDSIVLFTASDFGRTLSSNNRGSDHAWGGNQFVLGGPVLGKKIYGSYPSLGLNPETGGELNPLDTGRGRLIPTTSCDAYFAELALWLGVPRSSLSQVFPNIGNFISTSGTDAPLGFLG